MRIHSTLTQLNGSGVVTNKGCLSRVAIAVIVLIVLFT